MKRYPLIIQLSLILLISCSSNSSNNNLKMVLVDGYVDNNGVKIHYVEMGEGPLIVFIHGFPDFSYTWRHQMEALSRNYKTVAIDLRGYNLSDAPEGVENYKYDFLISDILSVIHHFGETNAIIVGHDWGGAISWRLADQYPDAVNKLIICNIPHPQGLFREVSKQDQGGLSYANKFLEKDAYKNFTPNWLSGWIKEPKVRKIYKEAFERSSIEAMLNYYQANFGRADTADGNKIRKYKWKNIQSPVLIIYGKKDKYLPVNGLNYNWEFIDNDMRIEIIQDAGHFVQYDAPDAVTNAIVSWLGKYENNTSKLDFLVGNWKIEGREQYELWKKIKNDEFIGYSYELHNDQKAISETLSIKKIGNQIMYEAMVPDQNKGKTIQFTLNTKIKSYFSFENDKHDFPKKIQYKKITDDEIVVTVLGDNSKGFSYTQIKQKTKE